MMTEAFFGLWQLLRVIRMGRPWQDSDAADFTCIDRKIALHIAHQPLAKAAEDRGRKDRGEE